MQRTLSRMQSSDLVARLQKSEVYRPRSKVEADTQGTNTTIEKITAERRMLAAPVSYRRRGCSS